MKRSKVDPKITNKYGAAVTVIILMTAVVLSPRSKASAVDESSQDIVPNELVVEVKPGASIDSVNARNNTITKRPMNGTNFYLLKIPHGANATKWQEVLGSDPDVLKAYLNPTVSSPLVLNGRRTLSFPSNHAKPGFVSTDYLGQSGLDRLKLEQAHLLSQGKNVVVAVIDTGVDLSHPALVNHLWTDDRPGGEIPGDGIDNDGDGYIDDYRGWNFIDNNNDPSEEMPKHPKQSIGGHGTFIAGLIALVAPEARIMPLKAFEPNGKSDAFTVAAAIKFAADHGANVINLSFGAPVVSSVLADAIADAKMRCVVMAAAVGNDNTEIPQFPASSSDVVGVAAVDADDTKASFSNYGADVSVAAPGVNLISTYPGGGYARWSGTSFATPLTSGEGALLFGADSLVGDLEGIIKNTADSIDSLNPTFEGKLGKGRIDPLEALESLYVGPAVRLPKDVYSQVRLTAAETEHSARGIVEIAAYGPNQEVDLEVNSLTPRSLYKVVINGVEIQNSTATSDNMGGLLLSFSSNPVAGDIPLPSQFQPVTLIRHVELQDNQGRVVLAGDYAPLGTGSYPSEQTVDKEAYLASADPNQPGGGRVTLEITSDRATLVIVAGGIQDSSCAISVDGVGCGWATTQGGYIRMDLSSDGSTGKWVPGALQPVIKIRHVEVRDRTGQIVLEGDFRF
jgi:subtilisin family serine protease